ncbi:hypothetical protein [Microcoleus sp. BROC3]|uniref:hypothetical protein n=1 Tax=Microcoleus sp. BROC3 TaxID=3055323 RepID=UPI002FD360E9
MGDCENTEKTESAIEKTQEKVEVKEVTPISPASPASPIQNQGLSPATSPALTPASTPSSPAKSVEVEKRTIINRGRAERLADEYREAKANGDTEMTEKIRAFIESAEGIPLRGFFKQALNGKKENDTQPTIRKQPLAIGDSVEITLKSDRQGKRGEIIDIGYGARETTYYVKLENEKVIVEIPMGAESFAYLRKL